MIRRSQVALPHACPLPFAIEREDCREPDTPVNTRFIMRLPAHVRVRCRFAFLWGACEVVSAVFRRLFLIVGLLAVLIAVPASALAQATPSPEADPAEAMRRGAEWLVSQQGDDGAWVGFNGASDPGVTIDAVIALAAAQSAGFKVDLTSAVAYLEANGKAYAQDGTGQAAKLALAAVAVGQDPTTFASFDSIEKMLKGYNPNTDMYGTGLYDTALVMLALGATGEDPPGIVLKSIDEKTTRLIIRSQGDYEPDLRNPLLNFLLWRVVYEPAHFIMERRMLLGIKERAEKLACERAEERRLAELDHSGW